MTILFGIKHKNKHIISYKTQPQTHTTANMLCQLNIYLGSNDYRTAVRTSNLMPVIFSFVFISSFRQFVEIQNGNKNKSSKNIPFYAGCYRSRPYVWGKNIYKLLF